MKNFKILTERENPLFKRREIKASVEAEVTPSRVDTEKLISEKFSTQTENIKIKKISGKFGSKTFTITTNIYNSKEDKDNTELKSKKDIEAEKKPKEQTTEQSAQPVETQEATEKPVEEPAEQPTKAQPEEKEEGEPKEEIMKGENK